MTTVKMPRSHERSRKEIQRQRSYFADVKEAALTIGAMIFFLMALWAATELSDWVYMTYQENSRLRSELQEEKTAYKAMFDQDALDKRRDDEEREKIVKKWQQENPKLAGIFNAR